MRPIKFRAWDKTNKKWLLGYDYENLGGFSLTGECVILGEFASLFRPLSRLNEIEIMQFTGLEDKNGKEIYEGDIVRNELFTEKQDDIIGEIKWVGCGFWFVDSNMNLFNIPSDIEIIGNIYENPELLK